MKNQVFAGLICLVTSCSAVFPVVFIPEKITSDVYGYLSKQPDSHKTVLFLPGASGYDEAYSTMVRQFQADGWNTLILDYYRNGLDIPGKSVFSSSAEDYQQWKLNAKNAINFLIQNNYASADSLVIVGFSRGASIAFAVGNADQRVAAIIS
jgi:dienelactone hydrolase